MSLRLRLEPRAGGRNGFTLIELLVTVSIIGILILTAVPHYKSFRARAFDFRAQSDLRMVALGEEAYFLDKEEYLACTERSCNRLPGVVRLPDGVSLTVTLQDDSYIAVASHGKGTGKVFSWDGELGGMTKGTTSSR